MRRRTVTLVALALLLAGAGRIASARSTDTRLSLVGYAVPREALGAVIKAWQQTPDGRDVSFTQSYGASGDQARAVAAGLKADVVQLSTGLDVDLLVKAGLVDSKWDRQSSKGIATNSIVVFAVRDGNPKKIKNWNDLAEARRRDRDAEPALLRRGEVERPGRLRRAAAARQDRQAGDRRASSGCSENVVSLDTSGRNATNTFLAGKGDVFITYENEARLAKLQYVIPRQTLLIEAPIAVIKTSENRDVANKFIRFTKTRAGAAHLRAVRLPAAGASPSTRSSRSSIRAGRASSGSTTSTSAAGRAVDKKWFDPDKGVWRGSRAARGSARWVAGRRRSHRRAAPRRSAEREGVDRPLARLRHDVPDARRRAADGGARLGVDEGRAPTASGRSSRARRRSRR